MRHDTLDATYPTEEAQVSRRSLLLGLLATGAFAVPLLSTSTQAAVSMLRSGIDPDAVESEITPAGKKGGGGRGGGGKGRGGGGRGGGHGGRGGGKGHGRGKGHGGGYRGHGHGKSRSRVYHHYYYGRRRYGHGGYYGGYGWNCYNPWYRRRYWYRCVGWY
jgi:hypothetical protein